MSGKLIGQVYERKLGHAEQSVLLAMSDHADDFGANCFPSVPYIAWKTGYAERQVQRLIARLRDMGVLILVRDATRYRPTEYHVNLDALPMKPEFARGDICDTRGDIPAASGVTFTAPGVTFEAARGDIYGARGDIAMSPEPSWEPKTEPPIEPKTRRPRSAPAPSGEPDETFSTIVLAAIEASIGGASLKLPGGKLKPGIGQTIGLLGEWTGDDAPAAVSLWQRFAASKEWQFKGHTSNWPIAVGDWRTKTGGASRPGSASRTAPPVDIEVATPEVVAARRAKLAAIMGRDR